jgi:hypothetical protein
MLRVTRTVRPLLLLLALSSSLPAHAEQWGRSCASDADCDAVEQCDSWHLCIPRPIRRPGPRPPEVWILDAAGRKSAGNGMIGAGMVLGVLGFAVNVGTWLVSSQSKSVNLDGAGQALLVSAALMSAGSMAAGGFVLRAIVSHDEHGGADHGRAHARQRWRAGTGLLVAGAALFATAAALIPVALGAGSPPDTQAAAAFSSPALLTLGSVLTSVGVPLVVVGSQDGGGLRF